VFPFWGGALNCGVPGKSMVGTQTAAQAARAGQPTSEIIVNGSELVHRFPGKFRVANWFGRPFLTPSGG
jgi:hypothetical protein